MACWLAYLLLTCGCTVETPPPSAVFREVASGLDFVHVNGMSGQRYFCEIVGAGCALFDYDSDGDLDLYAVQGAPLPTTANAPSDVLYKNLLIETGELRYEPAVGTGLDAATGYGMGVAVGDYDSDGWLDLYVTNFGPNQLWRNRGDGTFEDVTATSHANDERWSTSSCFVDYDQDGDLDLYIGNYVDFRLATHKPCYSETSALDYCGPLSFRPYPDRLLQNQGDGTFVDVSAQSRIAAEYGGALGVVATDLNGDGAVDLYVANDGTANQCWINRGDGTFENTALLAGCAFNIDGKAEASMGIDAADCDGDGDDDLFMSHLTGETNTLYLNDGKGTFDDHSMASGLGVPSRTLTGFGTAWFDYDNDGTLDLFLANGAVKTIEALASAGDPFPLHQRNQLFRGVGAARFEEISATAEPVLQRSEVSRGAAFGDVDNDGDTDVVVCNNNGPLRLLLNQTGNRRPWIGLHLKNTAGRTVDDARVEAVLNTGQSLWRRARRAASYCSSNDPRVLLGLGEHSVRELRVHWNAQQTERFAVPALQRWHTIQQGRGEVVQ
ncbi:MAG: CRTAC1 family protein [Planctomycetota bacterium]